MCCKLTRWTFYALVGVLALGALLGCNAARVTDSITLDVGAQTATFDDWQGIAPGMQRRDLDLAPYSNGTMQLVRLDPASVTFRVHYAPDDPLTLPGWQQAQPDAALIVNGGFFNPEQRALGLLVSDGQVFGQTFVDFGGMFSVSAQDVRVRSLVTEPYPGGEALTQAVQGYPVLVETGGVMARQGDGFDVPSRRTWIGQDHTGAIVIGMTHSILTLAELQTLLLGSDLNLWTAFGLDGGRSSGLLLNVPGYDEYYPAFDRLPVVLAVYTP